MTKRAAVTTVLGLDITNNTLLDAVWPILANRVAIGVNQAWAGHPGRLVMQGPIVNPGRDPAMGSDVWQCWAKAMPGGADKKTFCDTILD